MFKFVISFCIYIFSESIFSFNYNVFKNYINFIRFRDICINNVFLNRKW